MRVLECDIRTRSEEPKRQRDARRRTMGERASRRIRTCGGRRWSRTRTHGATRLAIERRGHPDFAFPIENSRGEGFERAPKRFFVVEGSVFVKRRGRRPLSIGGHLPRACRSRHYATRRSFGAMRLLATMRSTSEVRDASSRSRATPMERTRDQFVVQRAARCVGAREQRAATCQPRRRCDCP